MATRTALQIGVDIGGTFTDIVALDGDGRLTLTKVPSTPRSPDIGAFADSLPRALCWAAAWDMTRDAEMPARDYVALVLHGIGGETDIGVVQSLLRQAAIALNLFGTVKLNAFAVLRLMTSSNLVGC